MDKDEDDICPECNGTGELTGWVNGMPEVAVILIIGVIILYGILYILQYFGVKV